jgi:sigma-B regulation protein RsbU (phosphoserine phosphatase)
MLLKAVLDELGYRVTLVENGREACEWLQDNPCAMVISDWMMPEMDGLALCRWVRSQRQRSYIYFILLTSQSDRSALVEGMEAGADDYLVKPLDSRELRVRINAGRRVLALEKRLERRHQQLERARDAIEKTYNELNDSLRSAATLQATLLPRGRQIRRLERSWWFQPSHGLAGDVFNFLRVGSNALVFFQIDVSGHGVPSALLSFSLHALLSYAQGDRGLLLEGDGQGGMRLRGADAVVEELNRRFPAEEHNQLYFTMVYGLLDLDNGHGQLCQAGHPAPLIVRRNSEVESVGEGGFPVGLLADVNWESYGFDLAPGDQLFLYSDGVTECADPKGELFGERRLLAALAEQPGTIAERVARLRERVEKWRGQQDFSDDISVLGLGWRGGAPTSDG